MELINGELIYTQYCRGSACEIASEKGKGACSSAVPTVYEFKTMLAVGTDMTKLYLARRFLHHHCYI
jgi:hypothetical protein